MCNQNYIHSNRNQKNKFILNSSFHDEFFQNFKEHLPALSTPLPLLLLHFHSKPPKHEINQFNSQQEIHHQLQI